MVLINCVQINLLFALNDLNPTKDSWKRPAVEISNF